MIQGYSPSCSPYLVRPAYPYSQWRIQVAGPTSRQATSIETLELKRMCPGCYQGLLSLYACLLQSVTPTGGQGTHALQSAKITADSFGSGHTNGFLGSPFSRQPSCASVYCGSLCASAIGFKLSSNCKASRVFTGPGCLRTWAYSGITDKSSYVGNLTRVWTYMMMTWVRALGQLRQLRRARSSCGSVEI